MRDTAKNILVSFFLNFFFVIIEIVGGILTNSIAILSDSIHDFGDCLAIICAYFFEKKSKKPPNKNYPFGYGRYSVISALITSFILFVGGAIVVYSSINRIMHPKVVNGIGMLIIAVFGILLNGLATIKTAKSNNINEKSISLHMLEDTLGWIVVFLGSLIVSIFNVYLIDPIMSILVTIYIVYRVLKNLKIVFEIFLEKTPKDFNYEDFEQKIFKIEGIKEISKMKVWAINDEIVVGQIVVIVENNSNFDEKKVKQKLFELSKEFKLFDFNVQIDY